MKKMDVVSLHSGFFAKNGFVFNHSQMLFEKDFIHGKQVIIVHYVEAPKFKYIEYFLGIRINSIEEIIHKYLPTPNDNAEESITLVQTPHNLGNFSPGKIKVTNNKELYKVVNDIEKFFEVTGFNWLNQMIDPVTLEQEFLNHMEDPFETYSMVEAAFRSTALSRLYNPADYPILRQSFLEKINCNEMTPFTIATFLQFLNYLDHLKSVAA